MGAVRQDDKLEFFKKPKPPDPRTLERWQRRLEVLSNREGYVLHCTLALSNTRIFYTSEVRDSTKHFLAQILPSFVLKLEGDWQRSGFLFPHAHLLLPVLPEVRPFLVSLKMSGAKVVRLAYQNRTLPDPLTLLPDQGPINVSEYLSSLPDLTPLGALVNFRETTITTLKNSPSLAKYLGKSTYQGGLSPVIEHGMR